MNVKKKARRVMSGLLTAVTVLSTVLSPVVAYASEDAGSIKKIPYYEEIKDQLDEDEVVTAKDYEIKVGDNFDVKSDYTGLTIQDDSKVKVTFQEAKDTDGNDFSTDYANSYKAVYYVEPQTTDHPTYQINRKIVVKEADQQKDSQSESSSDQDAGSSDKTETEDSEADSSTEETGAAETESKTELTEKEFDAEIEATENQETVDPETGITLSEVMQEAVDQEVALADLEAGESITFDMPMMLASGETGTKSVTVTAGSWYYYADYGLGSYLTCPYYVKWGSINATAYCVEPSKKGPGNGTYTIQKLADGKTLAKVCYYGTKASDENGFFDEKHPDFPAGKRFIITHLAAAYANGSSDWASGTNATGKNLAMELYRKKLHRHEKIPDDDNNLNSQKKSIRKKQLQKQMTKEQAKAGRLSFDDEGNQMVKGAGMKPGGTAGKYIATQAVISGMKAVTSEEEETDENAGVESARLAERETEAALRGLRHAQIRSKRTDVKTHRRGYREATVEKKLKFGSAESMEGVKHAESVKNAEQKRHFYNRFFQKKRYKDAYRAARAGKSAGSLGGATTITGVENMTVKAKIALKEIIKRNRAMFAGIGIFALLFLVIAVSLGSCSASIEGAGSVIGITTYPSSDEDIYAAENRYAALESALNQQINEMERRHPNYDEYQYNIAEIGHNPYHLISYLTAKYGDWTYSDVENELQSLFEAQYHLNTEGRTETVTETRNVRVGESLGQVVTSGYCNCRICCGVWSGGPTASGAYPTANHTIAVDASNPFVPIGTKVVMNGVEYTVEDTGAFARYGVQFDVYYDNHAAASAHGHQTWEAYIADDNGSQEVTVTSTSTKKILYVTLTNGSFDAVARANLNAEQLIIYNALNTTYGNRNYLWDVNNVTSGSGGNGMSYEIPPEALQDEEFARMIREAEKYLGVPYVWGGYSPSGFDCSGFVSYVINHCGNGWNYGRLTADGLRGVCTYVSPQEAKPGDLIFFQGTYNTSGASHVGIYVGNNMMIHCGDPIHYSNISTSYWQQHFMCFGRLP